eukprot:scaffold24246_cov106-Isochrysis_galbana.AAC.4
MKLASMTLPCWVRRVRSRHAAMADLILTAQASKVGSGSGAVYLRSIELDLPAPSSPGPGHL